MVGARSLRVVSIGVLIAACLVTSACSPPPVITKAQAAAKKFPKHHPNLSDAQKKNCQACHKVVETAPAKQ